MVKLPAHATRATMANMQMFDEGAQDIGRTFTTSASTVLTVFYQKTPSDVLEMRMQVMALCVCVFAIAAQHDQNPTQIPTNKPNQPTKPSQSRYVVALPWGWLLWGRVLGLLTEN